MTGVEKVVRRERAVTGAGLAVMVLLAWAYVWQGAGMGMSALDMTSVSLFPHREADMAGEMESSWPVVVAMWWVMMIAMMTPSAAPFVLLYGAALRHHSAARGNACVPTAFLAAGYLSVWLLFSIGAAVLQAALQPAGLLSAMMLWSKSALLSAAILAAAGLYQLSPLKRVCLAQCRSPVQFLARHWRPGRSGAFMIGFRHGAFCIGCCWTLMALLFVGGVMNLVWIALLTLLVLTEKLAPAGEAIGKATGVVLLVWAGATLLA
ncbi:MAG: metal-binding protein [Betaproteobacteria bacterium RIFCSPLOWO2_12_FULL_65_14]|nr:MAG: metal-binding protein [Betaproteobacteria bacterium RIFCSPLOWO2_12_FULL_65_14]